MADVVCLRPLADFTGAGVTPPEALDIAYLAPDAAGLAGEMARARALVLPAVGPALPAALFAGSALRLVQVTGAGVDRLDIAALSALGIPVANVPGGSDNAVAEYVLAAAVALLRGFGAGTAAILGGRYAAYRGAFVAAGPHELDGLVVGVVGIGRIGRKVAERCRAAGARIVYADPGVTEAGDAAAVDLGTLLSTADVVSLHVPRIAATEGLIGAGEIARMRASAILVNAARGGIVDEAALAAALVRGAIAGAAVDVYAVEPPGRDCPLLALPPETAGRVILTPHIAGVTRQSWARLFGDAWDNVQGVVAGGVPPRNVVNGL